MKTLVEWWAERPRPAPTDPGYPADSKDCLGRPIVSPSGEPIPWSFVVGAEVRHEFFDWQKCKDGLQAALRRKR